MDKMLKSLITPHIVVTRGPFGWTCDIRGAGGMVVAHGFAPCEFGDKGRETTALRVAVKSALAQLA